MVGSDYLIIWCEGDFGYPQSQYQRVRACYNALERVKIELKGE